MQEITDTTNGRLPAGLAIAGREFVQAPLDGCQASVDRGQPRRDGVYRRGRRLGALGRGVAAQDGVEVLGVPAQRQRQRFERAGTAAALGGVAVQLAHDGHRYAERVRPTRVAASSARQASHQSLARPPPSLAAPIPPRSALSAEE
jgi:hypothetical protein